MIEDIHVKEIPLGEEKITPGKFSAVGLEGYDIQCEIGRGEMAVVYEAIEKSLNRVVALKVLNRELSKDSDIIRRFIYEARATAHLSHPNIVQIYSIGEEKGVYYFAMEYVRGSSVENILKEGKRISVREGLTIIRQTVVALQAAYKSGVIHCDIKPGNLLITEQGVVKVADFGLAGEVKGASRVPGNKIIGTSLYTSPEQSQGKEGDHRSDMYSLGITFYQMFTRSLPFISGETKELIKGHIKELLPPLPPDIPPAVAKLLFRLTDKDPDKRFSEYKSLIETLDRIYNAYVSRRCIRPRLLLAIIIAVGVTIYSFFHESVVRKMTIPLRLDKARRVKAVYRDGVKYACQHPEASRKIIEEYFRIIKEHPDTEWSFRAEQKIDMIILAVAKDVAEKLNELKIQRDELIAENKYQDAINEYQVIKSKYRNTAAESIAQENINYIYEQAQHQFQRIDEEAKGLLNRHKSNEARELYKGVIATFGMQEFTDNAKEKMVFIDELEQKYRLNKEARATFEPIEKEVEKFLEVYKYNEARKVLTSITGRNKNPWLDTLVKDKLAMVKALQMEYKKETQYAIYQRLDDEVKHFVAEFRFDEAVDIIGKNMSKIRIPEYWTKLENLLEKVKYLQLIKSRIITGVNEVLTKKEIDRDAGNISDSERSILIVEGSFKGIPWKECSPEEIYQLAVRYIEKDDPNQRIALGVFCLVYGLLDESRKEFALVLHMDPGKQDVVEKYLIQLANVGE